MKKKNYIHLAIIAIILFILFIVVTTHCEGISTYKDTYIIFGDKVDQCKYQVSFRYGLCHPFNSGVYFAYTQKSKWDIYDQSSPFRETNYEPALFWERQNLFILDYLRVSPYQHRSNGCDGDRSRSLETGFIQMQMSYGKVINTGINFMATWHYKVGSQNYDIKRYQGYCTTQLFLQLKGSGNYFDQEKIAVKGEWTAKSYWIQTDLTIRLLTKNIRPKIYIQWFYGTSEWLENYKEKTNSFRVGFIFTPEEMFGRNNLEEII